jgi:hypothetical protein
MTIPKRLSEVIEEQNQEKIATTVAWPSGTNTKPLKLNVPPTTTFNSNGQPKKPRIVQPALELGKEFAEQLGKDEAETSVGDEIPVVDGVDFVRALTKTVVKHPGATKELIQGVSQKVKEIGKKFKSRHTTQPSSPVAAPAAIAPSTTPAIAPSTAPDTEPATAPTPKATPGSPVNTPPASTQQAESPFVRPQSNNVGTNPGQNVNVELDPDSKQITEEEPKNLKKPSPGQEPKKKWPGIQLGLDIAQPITNLPTSANPRSSSVNDRLVNLINEMNPVKKTTSWE